jgi:hypothetical protein
MALAVTRQHDALLYHKQNQKHDAIVTVPRLSYTLLRFSLVFRSPPAALSGLSIAHTTPIDYTIIREPSRH